ncbi:MAG: hypothetical protein JW821_13350 [Deltaproteobacteria bacterium]|nr:hypothetical protein [Deltaproteobacteria bacterium]
MTMCSAFSRNREKAPASILAGEEGYLLIVVTFIGLILGILFSYILPQLHTGQMKRAINNLNEYRAYEAARRGTAAVQLGLKSVDNFQDLMGYTVTGVTDSMTEVTGNDTFEVGGRYSYLFSAGMSIDIRYSTGYDGFYTVTGSSEYPTSGTTVTGIGVEREILSGTSGILTRRKGLLYSMERITGTSGASTFHDEYRDEDGNVQFVAGCRGIDLGQKEEGRLDVLVLVSRQGTLGAISNGIPCDDCWYLYRNGVTGPTGSPWLSADNWTSGTTENGEYVQTSVHYFDLDLKEDINGTNYGTNTDVKAARISGRWYLSVGNDGTWRGEYSGQELWGYEKDFLSGTTPFQGKDNDGDGDIDQDDEVEVFVAVRSTGITAAPGANYETNKKDLVLVHDANPNIPNPMRQVLEAGFYLEGE